MQISDRLSVVRPSLTLAVNSKALELKAKGVDIISLAVGEPDFPTPEHVCAAAKAAMLPSLVMRTRPPGTQNSCSRSFR